MLAGLLGEHMAMLYAGETLGYFAVVSDGACLWIG